MVRRAGSDHSTWGLPWVPADGVQLGTALPEEFPADHLLHDFLTHILHNRGIARERAILMETR
eukprot:4224007-Alexandrium_andersonii.AAC.1